RERSWEKPLVTSESTWVRREAGHRVRPAGTGGGTHKNGLPRNRWRGRPQWVHLRSQDRARRSPWSRGGFGGARVASGACSSGLGLGGGLRLPVGPGRG